MPVIASFRDGLTILSDNPKLLAAGVLVSAVGHLATLEEATGIPVGSTLASLGWLLAFPFLLGGFIGMTTPAIKDEDTSFDRFFRTGRRHYGRLLVAPFVFVAIVVGAFVLVGALSFVPLILLITLGGAVEGAPLIAAGTLFATGPWVTLAVLLGTIVCCQFYATAIVVENENVTGAFRRSLGLVRRNVRGVLGFSLAWGMVTGFVLSPGYMLLGVMSEARIVDLLTLGVDPAPPILVPVLVLATAVAFAYSYTVYTAYYVRLVDETPGRTNGSSTV